MGPCDLEDVVHDLLRRPVGDAEIDAGDRDEAQDDGGGLGHLTAVGPLHALQLGPRGAQEVHDPVAAGPRPGRAALRLVVAVGPVAPAAPRRSGLDGLLRALGLGDVGGLAVGALYQGRVELLDLAGGVLELARKVLPAELLAVARALTMSCHGPAGLPG